MASIHRERRNRWGGQRRSAGDSCTTPSLENTEEAVKLGNYATIKHPGQDSNLRPAAREETAFLIEGGATVGAIGVDLERLAADLRQHLTPDQRRLLARILTSDAVAPGSKVER